MTSGGVGHATAIGQGGTRVISRVNGPYLWQWICTL